MRYGILCAMAEEIHLLKEDIQAAEIITVAGREFLSGTLYGQQVVLVMSHIGKVAAAMTATLLIDRFSVDAVLFTGTAGGMAEGLTVGDIVVGDQSLQHDFFIPDAPLFSIPMLNRSYFDSDASLSDALFRAAEGYLSGAFAWELSPDALAPFHIGTPKVTRGAIASGDQFICDRDKKQWLVENIPSLQCVEMEGGAVAQVCHQFGVPFALFRVISDSAEESSPVDFAAFIQTVACYFTRGVVRALLESN